MVNEHARRRTSARGTNLLGMALMGGVGTLARTMRGWANVVAVVLLVACGPPEDHYVVSVGGGGELSGAYTGCTHAPSRAVRFVTADRYMGVAPGIARLTCTDRNVVLDVREPARIVIDAAPTVPNTNLVFSIDAYDASGVALDLGEDASITWSFGGTLVSRAYPGCGDIIPICLPHNDGFAAALAPGPGTIDATFHGLHAHASTTVLR